MRRDLSVLLIALLLVGGLSAAAVAVNANGSSSSSHHGKADKADHPGPPSWAHAGRNGKDREHGRSADKSGDKQAWKKHWHDLTPAQRAAKMAELAQAHADGMKKFAACVKAAGKDDAKRAACERPLPPGLAKKLLH